MADLLARLISDCHARLAALDIDAAHAAQDGALRAARAIHAKSLEVRRELDQLQARNIDSSADSSTPVARWR